MTLLNDYQQEIDGGKVQDLRKIILHVEKRSIPEKEDLLNKVGRT